MSRASPYRYVSRRKDPAQRTLWLGDWRHVLRTNLALGNESVRLVVLTAPGRTVLPFDRTRCKHGPGVKCSGTVGCRVNGRRAHAWNKRAPGKWRELHRQAATRTRAKFGAGTLRMMAKAWEPQQRGVYHVNVVLYLATARQRAAADHYVRELARLAPRYGWGRPDRARRVRTANAAAFYLSKYFTERRAGGKANGESGKLGIGDTAARSDCPRSVAYVDRNLTQVTRQTMRECRRRRYRWVIANRYYGGDVEAAKRHLAFVAAHRAPRDHTRRGALSSTEDEADAYRRAIAFRAAQVGMRAASRQRSTVESRNRKLVRGCQIS